MANEELESLILKHALANAIKFDGKANPGAVIGKIISEQPELKENIKGVAKEVNKIIKQISKLSVEKQRKQLEEIAPELLEKKEQKEKDIFAFLGIQEGEKIKTAFPPGPEKYPHIGHAKALFLNHELARKYHGKFVLRFEDTNPKLVKEEFYKIMLENFRWLGVHWDKLGYASDHMELFYEKAEQLIEKGLAYVCVCRQEDIKKNRFKGIECGCRQQLSEENMSKWRNMHLLGEGEAILRLKSDMQHKNSAMRDPALIRIMKEHHARQGSRYSLWPTYDFQNAIMDGYEGITHRLRSKEFEMRNELQRHIQKILGYQETNIYEFARFNLEGVESSGRIIREKIHKGELLGWDDPTLTTIVALRRRGFAPEAIKDFVLNTGITKSESELAWDDLIVHNRRFLDAKCNRYFFIAEPTKITIENAPVREVRIKLHPDFEDRGYREFETRAEFYLSKKDAEELKEGELYRLMDCLNFVKKKERYIFDSQEYEKYKQKGKKIMHWLPAEAELASVSVMMPDKKKAYGLAEPLAKSLEVGAVVQFERFGFCRLDKKEKDKLEFWYTHK